MKDIRAAVQHLNPSVETKDVKSLLTETHNIYESLAVISKRAIALTSSLNKELSDKLEEFIITKDEIQEIEENKEQIEISRFYERLANPALIATNEFLEGRLEHRYRSDD